MLHNPRVGISQAGIIPGGRLRVILEVVGILNDVDIVPDILTSKLTITPEQIAASYGRSFRFNCRLLPRLSRLPPDFTIVLFNAMLNYYASSYDVLINSNNSLAFLPKHKDVISYVHFPRKRRIMADEVTIHQPNIFYSSWSRTSVSRTMLRLIYRLSRLHSHHAIVCNSKFTRASIEQVYGSLPELNVVYPPIDLEHFLEKPNRQVKRKRSIVTVGRFGSIKRQSEQIKLAERLPDVPVHIIGFANNSKYYQYCKQYVEKHRLTNVHLHPDAPFEKMLALLHECKYYLHTMINEPFGITTVQAIAAGCLPLVHDSGGQRETVPEPALRYQNLEEIPDMLEHLESLEHTNVDALVHKLQQRAMSNFDTSVFQRKMEAVLSPYLTD